MTQRAAALTLLERYGPIGLTWRELAAAEHIGHGSASRVLSDLHRNADVLRLTQERRDGCAVYVLPEYVLGRITQSYTVRPPADPEDVAVMAAHVLGVVARWGLDSSNSPAMHGLAADLRRAVNRPLPTDQPTLGVLDG